MAGGPRVVLFEAYRIQICYGKVLLEQRPLEYIFLMNSVCILKSYVSSNPVLQSSLCAGRKG